MAGHPHAVSRRRLQIRAGRTSGVEFGNRLVQIDTDPADQAGEPVQLGQYLLLKDASPDRAQLGGVQASLGKVGPRREPGAFRGRPDRRQLSVRQPYGDLVAADL